MWITKSSTSCPNAAIMKCTLCSIRPLMKCTLRLRRSSLETMSGAPAERASFKAVASPGRNRSASFPAPIWMSRCHAVTAKPSRSQNSTMSLRYASSPKLLRPCSLVLTRRYPIASFIVKPPFVAKRLTIASNFYWSARLRCRRAKSLIVSGGWRLVPYSRTATPFSRITPICS